MKTLLRTSALVLTLAAALAACSKAPLNVPLSDFSIQVDALVDTAGKVVYPKNPAKFRDSVVDVKSITLTGNLTYSATAGSNQLTLTFYASVDDPGNHSGNCQDYTSFYLCDPAGEKAISQPKTFTKGEKSPIELGSPNPDVLSTGINQGKIWIGALVQDSLALDSRLEFTDMVAHVVLF